MKNVVKSKVYKRIINFVLILSGLLIFTGQTYGYSPEMRRTMLSGPWEIVVQSGMSGSMMSFPVKIDDENKSAALDEVLPLMGSPIKIRLMQYLPDFKWDTSIVEDPSGGAVVKINAKGENLNQDILSCGMWKREKNYNALRGNLSL